MRPRAPRTTPATDECSAGTTWGTQAAGFRRTERRSTPRLRARGSRRRAAATARSWRPERRRRLRRSSGACRSPLRPRGDHRRGPRDRRPVRGRPGPLDGRAVVHERRLRFRLLDPADGDPRPVRRRRSPGGRRPVREPRIGAPAVAATGRGRRGRCGASSTGSTRRPPRRESLDAVRARRSGKGAAPLAAPRRSSSRPAICPT